MDHGRKQAVADPRLNELKETAVADVGALRMLLFQFLFPRSAVN